MNRPQVSHLARLVTKMLRLQRLPLVGKLFTALVQALGVDFPAQVRFGSGMLLPHCTSGLVVHQATRIGHDVTIFHGVTMGRADAFAPGPVFGGVVIEDGATICAGASVLGGEAPLTVGRGTVIAANSVLLSSTGANEVWAGTPARRIR